MESVDVGLKKGDIGVAIEVASFSKPEQEIANIRKCLEGSYDYVVSVSDDEKFLEAVRALARKVFTFKEKEKIRFFLPREVKEFLLNITPEGIVSEKAIVSGQIQKEKQLLNTKEAAESLGISKNTLYEWIVEKKIPYIKVGRLVKFRREDLEAWLKKRAQEERKELE